MDDNMNNEVQLDGVGVRLGKLPARSSLKALLFDDFLKRQLDPVPEVFDGWKGKRPFPLETFGNTEYGDCTIASQAIGAMRMERLEQRKTIDIPDKNIIDTYFNMTTRLYGGGDMGAYETDALSNWRKPDLTFRDAKGRPVTIDAYTRVNHLDHDAVRRALFSTAGRGIKVCFNLPIAWASLVPPVVWDIPEGTALIRSWMPGSWGGHSMWADSRYDKDGFWVAHTWGYPPQKVTWRAAAIYMDEVHWVVDSVNVWKKKKLAPAVNLPALVSAVNAVSEQKIKV